MNLDMTGRNVALTPALRAFTLDKLGKLERLVEQPLEAHVVLRIDKHRHLAEIQIKAGAITLSGAEETADLYASIGGVADKLERQLLKRKNKARGSKQRRAPREATVAAALEAADEPDDAAPRIVFSRRCRVRPMAPEDALAELEATAQDLLVFRETRTDRLNVLYRQRDGNFALVDPEPWSDRPA